VGGVSWGGRDFWRVGHDGGGPAWGGGGRRASIRQAGRWGGGVGDTQWRPGGVGEGVRALVLGSVGLGGVWLGAVLCVPGLRRLGVQGEECDGLQRQGGGGWS